MDRECDICQKNKATIHLQQIMGSKEINLHICDDCALENGISRDNDKIEVSLSGLFAGLVDVDGDLQRKKNRTCPTCGLTIKGFRKDFRPGCPDCFEVFSSEIHQYYEDHGILTGYEGKLPKKLEIFRKFFLRRQKLTDDLEKAVNNEEYEKAAEIRDRLKELEKGAS